MWRLIIVLVLMLCSTTYAADDPKLHGSLKADQFHACDIPPYFNGVSYNQTRVYVVYDIDIQSVKITPKMGLLGTETGIDVMFISVDESDPQYCAAIQIDWQCFNNTCINLEIDTYNYLSLGIIFDL